MSRMPDKLPNATLNRVARQWLANELAHSAGHCDWEELPGLTQNQHHTVVTFLIELGRTMDEQIEHEVRADPTGWRHLWDKVIDG